MDTIKQVDEKLALHFRRHGGPKTIPFVRPAPQCIGDCDKGNRLCPHESLCDLYEPEESTVRMYADSEQPIAAEASSDVEPPDTYRSIQSGAFMVPIWLMLIAGALVVLWLWGQHL